MGGEEVAFAVDVEALVRLPGLARWLGEELEDGLAGFGVEADFDQARRGLRGVEADGGALETFDLFDEVGGVDAWSVGGRGRGACV